MPKPHLTIAIPTFNRPHALSRLMRRLLPQLTEEVKIVILDNASEIPVGEYLESMIAEYPRALVRIVRNRVNVGANANILRTYEMCNTAWLWVVGDDDEVEAHAVATILRTIQNYPDCLLLNFPIDDGRRRSRVTSGLAAFVDAIDPSADIPWIASTVYRVTDLKPNLRFGYQYSFSMLPHVALLLMSFQDRHRAFFSTDHVAWRDRAEAATDQQTPIVNMALGFPTLMDLPIDLDVRRKLMRKLLVTSDSQGLPLRQLAYQLLLTSLKTGDRRNSLYCFDQACRRRFYFDVTLRERLEVFAYRFLLRLPPSMIAGAYGRVKRRPMVGQLHQDRVARL